MKRSLAVATAIALVLSTLSVMLLVRPAHARGPKWTPLPGGPFDIPAGYCAFPVHGDILADKEYVQVVVQPDGTEIETVTGTVKGRLTNTDTGRYVDLNVSGPGTFTFYPDGSATIVSLGNGLSQFDAGDQQQFGLPGVAYTSGRFVTHYAADGTLLSLTQDGSVTDVCAMLS